MNRPLRALAALVLILVAAQAAPAGAALETILQDDATLLYGSHAKVRAAMHRLRSLGVDRVRLTANWSSLARDADSRVAPAKFDATDPAAYEQARWRGLDQAVRLARRAGLKVLIDIGFYAPHWATSSGPGPRARRNVDAQAYAAFALAVARRYNGDFVPADETGPAPPPSQDESFLEALLGGHKPPAPLPPPKGRPLDEVTQFALWNEPNHPGLLLPQWSAGGAAAVPLSPAIYGRMIRAAYPLVKAARPEATFLVGNTSSSGGRGHGAVPPLLFLRTLACVDQHLRPLTTGACANFTPVPGDGWAHHPYTRNTPPNLRSGPLHPDQARIADLGRLASLLRRLAAAGRIAPALRQIHITEFGYESARVGRRPVLSPAAQARYLTWAEYLASRVPSVVSFAQFLLRDHGPGTERVSSSAVRAFGQYYTGLLTTTGAEKPAARAFVAGLFAQRRPGGRVMLWGRLRLGRAMRTVEIQRRRAGGAWGGLLQVRVGGHDAFTRTVRGLPSASYRLVYTDAHGRLRAGVPVSPVPGGTRVRRG